MKRKHQRIRDDFTTAEKTFDLEARSMAELLGKIATLHDAIDRRGGELLYLGFDSPTATGELPVVAHVHFWIPGGLADAFAHRAPATTEAS